MAEYIMSLMKQVAVFTIVAQTILHFRPNKSYEKYLKMLIGIMMLAIFILPFTELFSKNSTLEYTRLLEGYEKSIDRMYQNSDFTIDLKQETYLYTIQEEIKDRFNIVSKEYGYQVENVTLSGIEYNYEATEAEAIPTAGYVEVTLAEHNNKISTVQVDKIKLQNNKAETAAQVSAEPLNEHLQTLRQELAESIGIPEDAIRITVK